MNPQTRTADNKYQMQAPPKTEYRGSVHCPICTHTVQATVVAQGRSVHVKPGEKCPRCSAPLDAAFVFRYDRAA